MKDIMPYIEEANGEPLLIMVNDVEPTILQTLINSKLSNPSMFNIMIVEHDGFGDRKTEIMNDISAMTGATVCNVDSLGRIGYAEEIIVNDESTSILGGAADDELVQILVQETMYRLNDDELDENDRKYYRRRLATLKGGVAVIHVGGVTEVEMKERKDRIDDAVEAVMSSIDRGISIGGGYTFIQASKHLSKDVINFDSVTEMLADSLVCPFIQLCVNAELSKKTIQGVYDDIYNDTTHGFDVISESMSKLDKYNVYDPTGVLIDSLTNAVAVAKSILSIERIVYND